MKWIRRILIALVVVIVVVGVALYFTINGLIVTGVETGGNMVLGPKSTSLQAARLSPLGGKLSLTQLQLANPEEFKQKYFFELGQTDVQVSLGSLTGDKIVIPEVTLDGLHVTAETTIEKLPPKLNLIKIKKTVDENIGGGAKPSDPKQPAPPEAEGKKYVIQKLTVTNMKVTGALTMPGGASVPVNVPVPAFTIEGIGEKENGVVMKELIGIILDAVLTKAIEAVGSVGGVGLDMFEGGADALKGIGSDLLKSTESLDTKAVQDTAGKTVEGATKAVEGILGGFGKKKEEPTQEEQPAE